MEAKKESLSDKSARKKRIAGDKSARRKWMQ
jgi:hypothetical protein